MPEAELLQIAISPPSAALAVFSMFFGMASGCFAGVLVYCVLAYMTFFCNWKLQARHPD